ncbi:hypothetical protein KKC13_05590 [bacterium]|nr:hypothetical protein [bacterium]MBU1959234.1 hypothetical protein [bacterium]
MKYIVYASIVFMLVACGNQHEGQGELRLVGKEKKESIVEPEKSAKVEILHVEENRTALKSENFLLAELAAQAKWELIKLEAKQAKELKELDKEITLAQLNNQKEMESSKLANEKEITLATLENNKEIVIAEHDTRVKTQDKDNALYQLIAMITAGVLILFIFILFLMHRRSKNIEVKLHQDELRHKEMMEANKQHNENVRKMLEIVADENTDKGVKKEIVRLLKEQEVQKKATLLIEHK